MGNTDRERIADRQRQQEAVRLRLRGYTWQEVADQVGYSSRQAAQRGAAALLDRIETEDVAAYRAVEEARLDLVWRKQLEHLEQFRPSQSGVGLSAVASAVSALVRVSERRSKLLGLDAPTKVDVGASDVDLDSAVAAIMSALDGESDSGDDPGDSGAAGDTESDQ